MFVKLLRNWNNIRASIDLNILNKLVLPEEGFLREQAKTAIVFYEKVLTLSWMGDFFVVNGWGGADSAPPQPILKPIPNCSPIYTYHTLKFLGQNIDFSWR